jgi:hypothetical protein
MATKTLNLTSSGVNKQRSPYNCSFGATTITTSELSGKGYADLLVGFGYRTIFGSDYVKFNSITLTYKAINNRWSTVYKQGTVKTACCTTDSSLVDQNNHTQAIARSNKDPSSFTDTFPVQYWNYNDNKGYANNLIKFYIYNEASVKMIFYLTDISIKIDYDLPVASVTVSGGTVDGVASKKVTHGNSFTITATPPSGYKFVKWSDGNTDITRTITVTDSLLTSQDTAVQYSAEFELDKINKIYVDTSQPTGIYVDETNKKIVFVVNGTVSTPNSSVFDMWDGYHIVVQNSIPSGMEEIREVYVDTTKVYG